MAKKPKADTQPRFPYTSSPAALRRLLQEIPKRPRPGKLTLDTLKTWKVTGSNDATPLGVLKKLGLLGANSEPTAAYTEFMRTPPTGPRALGSLVREQYRELFETSHEPHRDTAELRTFFNINSGGGERAIELQALTFKALCEFAEFSGAPDSGSAAVGGASSPGVAARASGSDELPPVQIALHIHLPENKTARDYESIIQDIAKYIYGRTVDRG